MCTWVYSLLQQGFLFQGFVHCENFAMGGCCTEGFLLWSLTDLVVKRKGVFVYIIVLLSIHVLFLCLKSKLWDTLRSRILHLDQWSSLLKAKFCIVLNVASNSVLFWMLPMTESVTDIAGKQHIQKCFKGVFFLYLSGTGNENAVMRIVYPIKQSLQILYWMFCTVIWK